MPRSFILREPWFNSAAGIKPIHTGLIPAAEDNRRKVLISQSAECTFHGNVALLSGVRSTSFEWCDFANFVRRSIDDFVAISDDAAKSYIVKIIEANLYVRK